LPSSWHTLKANEQVEAMSNFLANVPRDIAQVIERPPISSLLRQGATIESLEGCLAIEIAKCSNMLTVGGNLRQGQSLEIAKELIAEYPNESLEDFCYCLRNGLKGKYSEPGKTFRFDIQIIFEWFKKYLDEKYEVIVDKLNREKDHHDNYRPSPAPILPIEKQKEWLKKWQDEINKIEVRKIPNLTDKEIIEEGGVKPARKQYDNGYTLEFARMRSSIITVAIEFYKGKDMSKGKHFLIEGHDIFALTKSDAEYIYMEALTK
jgi:hypothetical protein